MACEGPSARPWEAGGGAWYRWQGPHRWEQRRTEAGRRVADARELEAVRAEPAAWTAYGPLARAWRAFQNRRGRA